MEGPASDNQWSPFPVADSTVNQQDFLQEPQSDFKGPKENIKESRPNEPTLNHSVIDREANNEKDVMKVVRDVSPPLDELHNNLQDHSWQVTEETPQLNPGESDIGEPMLQEESTLQRENPSSLNEEDFSNNLESVAHDNPKDDFFRELQQTPEAETSFAQNSSTDFFKEETHPENEKETVNTFDDNLIETETRSEQGIFDEKSVKDANQLKEGSNESEQDPNQFQGYGFENSDDFYSQLANTTQVSGNEAPFNKEEGDPQDVQDDFLKELDQPVSGLSGADEEFSKPSSVRSAQIEPTEGDFFQELASAQKAEQPPVNPSEDKSKQIAENDIPQESANSEQPIGSVSQDELDHTDNFLNEIAQSTPHPDQSRNHPTDETVDETADDPFLKELSQPKDDSADKLAFLAMDDELLDEDLLEEILDDDLLEDDPPEQTQRPAFAPSSSVNPYAVSTPSSVSTVNLYEQKKKTDAYDFPTEFLRSKSSGPPKVANKYTNIVKQVETPPLPTMTLPKKEAFFEELPVQPVIQKRKRAGSRAVDPYAAIESPNSAPVSAIPPAASRRSSHREVQNPYAPPRAPTSESVPLESSRPGRSSSYVPQSVPHVPQSVPQAPQSVPQSVPQSPASVPSLPSAITNPKLKRKPSTISGRYTPNVSVQPNGQSPYAAAPQISAPSRMPYAPPPVASHQVQPPPKAQPPHYAQAPLPENSQALPQMLPHNAHHPAVATHIPQTSFPPTSTAPLKNPNALLHRQFPIWTWSQGPKVVKLIPKTDGYQVDNSVEVMNVADAGLLNPMTSFPGPLSAKSKRKDIEKWVEQLLESSGSSDPISLIWSVLLEILRYNGPLTDFALSKSIALLMNPSANIVNEKSPLDLSAFTTIKPKVPNAHQMDKSSLGSLLSILLSGDKNSALASAISEQDWALALLLGQLAGPQEFKTTFDFFLQNRFHQDPSLRILGFLLECIAGSVDAGSIDKVWLAANFGPVISIMLLNLDNPSPLFYQMGTALTEMGEYSKICFILAQCATLTLPEQPAPYDIDGILLDEVYSYIKEQQPSPQTVVRYIAHAGLLADYGKFVEARRYCDAVAPLTKSFSKTLHPNLVLQLNNLSARVSHLETSESGWFGMAKPNMDKVWGQLDKSFSKFVSGEDALPPAKVDENSVFSKYSPSLSRTQSVADLKSFPFPQRMTSHGSASMENLALSNAHRSATTPRLATVTIPSPKKTRNARGRYAPEPKAIPDPQLEVVPVEFLEPNPKSEFEPENSGSENSEARDVHSFGEEPIHLVAEHPQLDNPYFPKLDTSRTESVVNQQLDNPYFPKVDSSKTESVDQPQLNNPYFQKMDISGTESVVNQQPDNPYFPKMNSSRTESVSQNTGFPGSSEFPIETSESFSSAPPQVAIPQERPLSANRYAPPPHKASPPSVPPSAHPLSMNVDSADEDEGPYEDFVEDEDEESEQPDKEEKKVEKEKIEKPASETPSHNESGKKGWFGWLKKEKDENQPIRAKLGEQNQFFYDEKLKRWINKNAPPEENAISTPPPPPVKMKKPVPTVPTTSSPIPPVSAPPFKQNAPPSKPAPPPSQSASPPIKPPTSTDLDDIMAMAAAGGNARRGKRGPRRGYVDVMNQK